MKKTMKNLKFRIWDKQLRVFIYQLPEQHHLDWERFVVQQFTGLSDKNGKEIYEGDIAVTELKSFEVKWNYSDLNWISERKHEIEVIKNIYELENKKYQTTKEECEAKINKDYVCERCGRKIIAMETVDNANNPTFWAGCWHTDNPTKDNWGHFTGGVPKHIYELAEKLVCEKGKYYSHTDTSDYENKTTKEREYIFQGEQAGWAGLLQSIERLKNNPSRKTKKEVLEGKYF